MPSPLGSSVSVRIPILSDDGRYPLPCYIFEMCVSGLSSRHTCKCVGRLPDAEQDFIIFPFQQQAMGVVLLRVFAHLFPNQSPPRNLRRHVFEGDLRSATARAGGIFQQKKDALASRLERLCSHPYPLGRRALPATLLHVRTCACPDFPLSRQGGTATA